MSRKGFSLIEMLVVTAVTVVIGVAGFYLVTNRQGTTDLQAAAAQAVSALRTAQQNSLSAASSTAWGVRFDNTTSTAPRFVMFASSTFSEAAVTMSYSMSSRLSFDTGTLPAGSFKDVVFDIRTGKTASTSVMIRVTGRDKAYLINIGSNGLVEAALVTVGASTSTSPTVSGINPATGANSGSISITSISGTNFVNGATVRLVRSGQSDIVGTGFSVSGGNSLTGGSFNITSAQAGTWNVVVTNPDLQSATCSSCFTVTVPSSAPTATDVSPSSGTQGTTVTTTITGTNFVEGASVAFSGTGITVNNTVFSSQTSIIANITVASSATATARNVTVTNPDLQSGSCTSCFTVSVPVPTVTDVSPRIRGAGATGVVWTITGTNFVTGATPTFSGTGITVVTSSVSSATSMSVTVDIATNAAATSRDVTVTNPDTSSGGCSACVSITAQPVPVSFGVSSLGQGATNRTLILTGTGFQSGAVTSISGTGVTINSTTFVSDTSLQVSFTVSQSAATGTRNITVTNTDAGTGTGTGIFTVDPMSVTAYEPPTGTPSTTGSWTAPSDGWYTNSSAASTELARAAITSSAGASILMSGYNFSGVSSSADINKICVFLENVSITTSITGTQRWETSLTWDASGSPTYTTVNNKMADVTTTATAGVSRYFQDTTTTPSSTDPATACTTWSRTWTGSELSSANFGVRLQGTNTSGTSATLRFDRALVKVYYAPSSNP